MVTISTTAMFKKMEADNQLIGFCSARVALADILTEMPDISVVQMKHITENMQKAYEDEERKLGR